MNPGMLSYVKRLQPALGNKACLAPPGIDTQVFTPLPDRQLSEPYVLCVGRLDDSRKNLSLLLRAFALLPASLRQGARLVLAGKSAPNEQIWEQARQLSISDRLSYVGSPGRAQLVELYQHATAFALPSREEGLGIAALEAMACGVPVVATRCGGPEGIITDQHDGYLVGLGDERGLALRLESLLRDAALNRGMGEAAREKIERTLSREVVGETYLDIWSRMADAA
jgi:glycosyltransferase involved in cell wall biosynthesis